MKKFFSILIVNIILFIVFYFILIFLLNGIESGRISFSKFKKQSVVRSSDTIENYIEDYPDNFVRIKLDDDTLNQFCGEDRTIFNDNYSKNPIVVFGCSYAYGHGLKKQDSFPYKLSNITKRPVYSFAGCGKNAVSSLDTLIDFIKDNPEYKNQLSKVDYVVYVYMHNHISRFMNPDKELDFDYTGIYQYSNIDKIFNKNRITRYIVSRLKQKNILEDYPNTKKSKVFLKGVIKRWIKSVKEYVPNAKVIIILYDEKIVSEPKDTVKYLRELMSHSLWKEIELQSFGKVQVVHTQDLTGFVFDKNYKLKQDISDWHPNEKAWKVLTPLFVQKYINDASN